MLDPKWKAPFKQYIRKMKPEIRQDVVFGVVVHEHFMSYRKKYSADSADVKPKQIERVVGLTGVEFGDDPDSSLQRMKRPEKFIIGRVNPNRAWAILFSLAFLERDSRFELGADKEYESFAEKAEQQLLLSKGGVPRTFSDLNGGVGVIELHQKEAAISTDTDKADESTTGASGRSCDDRIFESGSYEHNRSRDTAGPISFEAKRRSHFMLLERLDQIDRHLLLRDLAENDLLALVEEKNGLIIELFDRGFDGVDPQAFSARLRQLLTVSHWNEMEEQRLKEPYIELTIATVRYTLSVPNEQTLALVFLVSDSLTALNRRDYRDQLIEEWRPLLAKDDSIWTRANLRAYCAHGTESGLISIDDAQDLVSTQPDASQRFVLAQSLRCGACLEMRLHQFDRAAENIESALAKLTVLPNNLPERRNLEAYLVSMKIILKWRVQQYDQGIIHEIDRCVALIRDAVPDDQVLIVGLLDMKVSAIREFGLDNTDEAKKFLSEAPPLIYSILERSILSYCVFSPGQIKARAAHLLSIK